MSRRPTFEEAAEILASLSIWIDEHPANAERDREAALWGRVAKVQEEAGEVVAALIGATGQNPRKGRTHEYRDVVKELWDVAITALAAVEHIQGNAGLSLDGLFRSISVVGERAGVSVSKEHKTERGT